MERGPTQVTDSWRFEGFWGAVGLDCLAITTHSSNLANLVVAWRKS